MSSHWNHHEEAILDAVKGIRILVKDLANKDIAQEYVIKGNRFYEQGEFDAAIGAYNEALRHDPESFDAHYNKGSAYGELSQYEEAVSFYEEAVKINPKKKDGYMGLSFALNYLKRYKEALQVVNKGLLYHNNDEELLKAQDDLNTKLTEVIGKTQLVSTKNW